MSLFLPLLLTASSCQQICLWPDRILYAKALTVFQLDLDRLPFLFPESFRISFEDLQPLAHLKTED